MRTRPTIAVLVVAAIGVAAAVFVWRAEDQGGARGGEGGALLGAGELPVDEVVRVTLRRGEETLVFERGESMTWSQTSPFAHPMDPYSIRRLAIGAAEAVVASRHEAGGADLGLDRPRAVLAYEWPGGGLTLELGRRGVAGRWYVRRAGRADACAATGELYERAVEMDHREWRDRALFPGAGIEAQEILIVDGDRRTLLRREQRTWMMIEPVRTRVDRAARDGLVMALASAKSGGFILDRPPDPAAFGLAEPAGSVTVRGERTVERAGQVLREPHEQTLLVGAPLAVGSQDRFGMVQGRPVVVRVPESAVAAIFREAVALVDPTGTAVEPADVQGLVVRGPQGPFEIRRELDRWTSPDLGAEIPSKIVEEFLEKLARDRAAEIDLRPYPRDLEAGTVTLVGPGNHPLDTVRVVLDPETGRIALENGDDVLRVMPPGFQISLTPGAFGLSGESLRSGG